MFVLKLFGLVTVLAVAVHAVPIPPPEQYGLPQLTREEEEAEEAAFLAMSLEERLQAHAEHEVYRPQGTVKCIVSAHSPATHR